MSRSPFFSNTSVGRTVLITGVDDSVRRKLLPGGEVTSTLDADRQFFLELLEQHGATVLAMLRRLCGNRHDADDLFQDVASRVWRNLHKRPLLRSPKAWLLTIAHRQFIDHLARRPVHASLLDHDEPARNWSAMDPAVVSLRFEQGRILDEAVRELPETLRSVIVLHYTGGLSLRETAQVIGVSAGTVKSRLNCGLQHLRRRLS